jgi:hypothetical protein
MTPRRRNREQQHFFAKTLYTRRETTELHAMREILLLRCDEIKYKLIDIAPDQLLKAQGEIKAYMDLLTLFDRAPLTDTPAE